MSNLSEKYYQNIEIDSKNEQPQFSICRKLILDAAIEKDPSKREELSIKLSEFLTQPGGIGILFSSVIDLDQTSQITTNHHQRFTYLSEIVARLPKLCMPYGEYCSNIVNQLKKYLMCTSSTYFKLAVTVISCFNKKDDSALHPIFDSLLKADAYYKPSEGIIVINNLLNCPNLISTEPFVDLFHQLIYAFVVLYKTPSRLKSHLVSVLVKILNSLESGPACCLIDKSIFQGEKFAHLYKLFTEEDEISIKIIEPHAQNDTELELFKMHDDVLENIVIELIEICDNEKLVLEFFFYFKDIMCTTKNERHRRISGNFVDHLLSMTEDEKSNLNLFSTILTKRDLSIELLGRALMNYISLLRPEEGNFESLMKLVENSIRSCIDIVEVLVATSNKDLEGIKRRILSELKQLRDLLSQNYDDYSEKSLYKSIDSLVSKLEDSVYILSKDNVSEPLEVQDEFMRDLNSKLAPVKASALIKLKQKIQSGNKNVIDQIPQLYRLVVSSIDDQDPYVFLAGINLLAEMCLRETEQILPELMLMYSKKDLDLQLRLNVGEVFVRLTKQLNNTIPYYVRGLIVEQSPVKRPKNVIELLIESCYDQEELIRMSSLISIGEISKRMSHSLDVLMIDVLNCIEQVIINDTIQVKCAAIDLLKTLLAGIDDKFKVESIQRELKSIYKLLKKIHNKTLDDNLALHLELAFDEMNRIARELLLGSNDDEELIKNIKVLNI